MDHTQKTALNWDELKASIAGGAAQMKGKLKLPEGAQKFLDDYGGDVGRGLAGATIGGALYGATASRRGYESEEEFKRRRFRGAMRTAALGGALGGLAAPIMEWSTGKGRFHRFTGKENLRDKGLPALRLNANRAKEIADTENNPQNAGNPVYIEREKEEIRQRHAEENRVQRMWHEGEMDPENMPKPPPLELKDNLTTGTTVAGAAGGGLYGIRSGKPGDLGILSEQEVKRLGNLNVKIRQSDLKGKGPGVLGPAGSSKNQLMRVERQNLRGKQIGGRAGRIAAGTGGGAIIGNLLGRTVGHFMTPERFHGDVDFTDVQEMPLPQQQ